MQEQHLRVILHIDLDAFYASVEQRDNPALRGRPVIVGGDPLGRGVVATASYEARKFGIHSAQSCRQAMQLCPEAIFLRPRFEVYRAISQQIQELYRRHTHLVEPLALDEAFLDVSSVAGSDWSAASGIARDLKRAIVEQTGLTASAGVSYNKMLAKLASGYQKPDGLTVITPQATAAFLDALPVGKIFGVGEVTAAKLKELGVTTGKELRQLRLDRLQRLFGKRGTDLYHFARGEDDRPVEPERERRSVGQETTLERDISDREEMLEILAHLAEQVESRLAELEIAGKTITLKVRWYDFQLVTRSKSVATPLGDVQTMMQCLRPLLDHLLAVNKPVRLLGVTVSNLVPQGGSGGGERVQMPSLWGVEGEEVGEL